MLIAKNISFKHIGPFLITYVMYRFLLLDIRWTIAQNGKQKQYIQIFIVEQNERRVIAQKSPRITTNLYSSFDTLFSRLKWHIKKTKKEYTETTISLVFKYNNLKF